MIISKNWLNEWIDLSSVSADEILKTLNSIGLEVDGCTKVKIPEKIVVGYVKSKEKHPDADKLNICMVDVGSDSLQIVCGAKNVEAGQFVAVALNGAVMPDGMQIKRAKLRGIESNGMICSSTELGLAKTNDGIMVLDESIGRLELGKELNEYDIFNDVIIEVDITANRGDANSIHGIARELSVALDLPIKERLAYVDGENLPGIGRILSLHTHEKVKSLHMFRAFELMQNPSENLVTKLRLALIECSETHPMRRLCEYATHSTGVIFRMYDFAKISTDEKISIDISVGTHQESILKVDDKILGVAGVYQNKDTMIDESSKLILLEASYADPSVVSEYVGENKDIVKTNELYRSTRSSEPNLALGIDPIFERLSSQNIAKFYAGHQLSATKTEVKTISFTITDINKMIGQDVPKIEIVRILKKLGFDVAFTQESENINVKVPNYRYDIINIHDVCEEIVRIVGIDNIASAPMKFSESNRINDTLKRYKFALNLRKKAAAVGFYESVHYVFDSSDELRKLGFKECKTSIINPINNELNELRPTLVNHLLKSCEKNSKNQKKSIKLFEYGEVFDENANQSMRFGFVVSGLKFEPSLNNGTKVAQVDFMGFASMIQGIVGEFSLVPSSEMGYLSPFEQAKIIKNGDEIGYIGRVSIDVASERDLSKTYVSEIYFDRLANTNIQAQAYSKFPSISRDLSLIIPKDMKFKTIKDSINSLGLNVQFAPSDIYSSDELGDNVSLSIKFTFQDMQKTLEDEEVACLMDKILAKLKDDLNIGIR
ncbi:phenylalanine--tRNA ligase subunit beta [Campylobacter majalis]|uniref:phenylalanine--tRNA ligase subunit beta n=1 Tax=Campylobacter majalis TaxID=2790656 RepID=UPI003D68BD94